MSMLCGVLPVACVRDDSALSNDKAAFRPYPSLSVVLCHVFLRIGVNGSAAGQRCIHQAVWNLVCTNLAGLEYDRDILVRGAP